MIFILDACAMIAWLRNESGAEVIAGYLADVDQLCLAHAVNLCEVYYQGLRESDETTAQEALEDLAAVGVTPRQDLDANFWQEAGRIKAKHRRVSLADCFAIALTLRVGGVLITSDHHELKPLADQGVCPIVFFR